MSKVLRIKFINSWFELKPGFLVHVQIPDHMYGVWISLRDYDEGDDGDGDEDDGIHVWNVGLWISLRLPRLSAHSCRFAEISRALETQISKFCLCHLI